MDKKIKTDYKFLTGINNSKCSLYSVLKNEIYSPRGKYIFMNNSVLKQIYYACTLCDNCSSSEFSFSHNIINFRQKLIEKNNQNKNAQTIAANLRKSGNIFGILE